MPALTERDGPRPIEEVRPPRPVLQLGRTRIPPRYRHVELADMDTTPGNEKALHIAARLLDERPGTRGAMFAGPVGVGKTHLVCAVALGWATLGRTVLFYTMLDWLRDMKETFDERSLKSESELLRTCAHADLFVLDDFGAERGTEWARGAVVGLVERLYNHGTTILVTTNLQLADVERLYDPRVTSRLMHMVEPVRLSGDDYRAKARRRA
jgi:DNA replication protein DnaC